MSYLGCVNLNQKYLIGTSNSDNNIIIQNRSIYTFNKNQKEFITILENDKYSSLCGDKVIYKKFQNERDINLKSILLEELLIKYTYNLENSCINQRAYNIKQELIKSKKIHQVYNFYNNKINKDLIINQFRNNKTTVSKILAPYIPNHPEFFRLIDKLDKNDLSKKDYYKLKLNIERLKLFKNYKEKYFIQLNIPSYNFTLYEKNNIKIRYGTVVGSVKNQTPILSSKLSHFIINPTWNIPDSIARSTIIPRALKDKNYLKNKNIQIHANYNLSSKRYRLKDIKDKLKKYTRKNKQYLPYKFIQLPSIKNGMGRVKYMFDNKYAVFMHDTIGTWRFKIPKNTIRFVSHGCIRLEHPLATMKHISTYYTKRSYSSIRKQYNNHEMLSVNLSKELPVHITYITSYISKKDKIKFYKDIYNYDKLQKLNFEL